MRRVYSKHAHQLQTTLKKPKFRWVLLAFGTLLSILLLIAVLNLINARRTKAAWFDDGYAYRQISTISNSGSAQTDYQVLLTVDTATLITAGKMQADCDDIRITNLDGNLLNYWIEEIAAYTCNTSTTRVWVKVPTIVAGNTPLYLYYGNPSAKTYKNGNLVFDLFDDFNDNSLDRTTWITDAGGSSTIVEQNNRIEMTPMAFPGNTRPYIRSQAQFTNVALDADMTGGVGDGSIALAMVVRFPDSGWGSSAQFYAARDYIDFAYFGNGNIHKGEGFVSTTLGAVSGSMSGATTYAMSLAVYGTSPNITTTFTRNGTATTVSSVSYSPVYPENYVGIYAREFNASNTLFVDNMRARKFVLPEPSPSSLSNEEKTEGPVAYWRLDEGNGSVANDATTSNNDATITSATWQNEEFCVVGKCLRFNGTFDRAISASRSVSDTFTLQAWVKRTADLTNNGACSGDQWYCGFGIVDMEVSGVTNDYGLSIKDNKLVFGVGNPDTSIMSTTTLEIGKWYFATATRTKSTGVIQLYVNGRLEQTLTTTNTNSLTAGSTTNIGNSGNTTGRSLTGFIDEPKVYDYVRTENEIRTDFLRSAGSAGSSATVGARDSNFLNDGLIAYWNMNEASGNITDSSGLGGTGTNTGTTTFSSGKYANASVHNGSSQYFTGTLGGNIANSSFTISGWVNETNLSTDRIWFATGGVDSANTHLHLRVTTTGVMRMGFFANDLDTPAGTFASGRWNYVTYTYDKSTRVRTIYLNGNRVASDLSPSDYTGTNVFKIGRNATTNVEHWLGSIDDVRVFNRALNNTEVSNLYNWSPGPALYWDMNEGSGTSTNDVSGNGFTGTVTNATFRPAKYGNGLNFDGNGDYLRTSSSTVNTGLPFTVSAWIYSRDAINSDAWMEFSSGTTCSNNPQLWIDGSANLVLGRCGVGSGPSLGAASGFVATWNHIAFAYDGTNTRAYKNGVLTDTFSYNWPSISTVRVTVGGSREATPSLFMDGMFDDFKMYSYARTQKEIVQDMNGGHPSVGSPIASAIGHWKFDEGADNTCSGGSNDACNSGSLGSAADGAISNMAVPATSTSGWQKTGEINGSLAFDNSNDYVDMGNNTALDPTTADLTVSAWVNPTSLSGSKYIVHKRCGCTGTEDGYSITTSGTAVRLYWGDGTNGVDYISSSGALTAGVWNHVVATFSYGNVARIYVNGIQISPDISLASVTGTVAITLYHLQVGRSSVTFAGSIDEVKLYNYALSSDEIKVELNAGASLNVGTGAVSEASQLAGGAGNPPIGYWNMDDAKGTTAFDRSTTGVNGTLTGGPEWAPGKYGSAVKFDGSNDYIAVGGSKSLNGARTLTAWVKPNDNTGNGLPILTGGVTSAGDFFGIAGTTGTCAVGLNELYMDHWGTTCYDSNLVVTPGKWNHVAITYSGSSMTFYVNGVKGSTISDILFDYDLNTYDIGGNTIGGTTTKAAMFGSIDEVKVFDYVLSSAQLAYDFNQGAPIAWYKFDECQGTTAYNAAPHTGYVAAGMNGTITPGGSGNTAAGTCNSGTSTEMWNDGTTGKRNSALGFDGTDDYITMGDVMDFEYTDSRTFCAWINPTSTAAEYAIISKSNWSAPYDGWVFQTRIGGGIAFAYITSWSSNAIHLESTATLTTNVWNHVCAVYDNTDISLYMNGKELPMIVNVDTISSSTNNAKAFNIGGRDSGSGWLFPGMIDDVRVYAYPLSTAQIQQVYNNGAVFFGPATGTP